MKTINTICMKTSFMNEPETEFPGEICHLQAITWTNADLLSIGNFKENISMKFCFKLRSFNSTKCIWTLKQRCPFYLTKISSVAALEGVKMTTFRAASDENFTKMMTFLFPWKYCLQNANHFFPTQMCFKGCYSENNLDVSELPWTHLRQFSTWVPESFSPNLLKADLVTQVCVGKWKDFNKQVWVGRVVSGACYIYQGVYNIYYT